MAISTGFCLPPQRIAVLAGGESAERAVSLESGAAVAKALSERGHRVTSLDPGGTPLERVAWNAFDVVFLALHGTFGEDGRIQAILDGIGIPYTGSDAVTSRLAMSKSASKERFLQSGVPTPPYVLINAGDDPAHSRQQAELLGYPLVVKPDAQGSSLGVSIVHAAGELPQALDACFRYDRFGVLEEYIAGSEWTVGVLDDLVLPIIRIEPAGSFYDYAAKYHDDRTRYDFDFDDLPAAVVKSIESAGRRAGRALGTRGVARVDLRLDHSHQPWVLEVNTIPGFTSHSLIPKAAARLGITFAELCERAVHSALGAAGASARKAS